MCRKTAALFHCFFSMWSSTVATVVSINTHTQDFSSFCLFIFVCSPWPLLITSSWIGFLRCGCQHTHGYYQLKGRDCRPHSKCWIYVWTWFVFFLGHFEIFFQKLLDSVFACCCDLLDSHSQPTNQSITHPPTYSHADTFALFSFCFQEFYIFFFVCWFSSVLDHFILISCLHVRSLVFINVIFLLFIFLSRSINTMYNIHIFTSIYRFYMNKFDRTFFLLYPRLSSCWLDKSYRSVGFDLYCSSLWNFLALICYLILCMCTHIYDTPEW